MRYQPTLFFFLLQVSPHISCFCVLVVVVVIVGGNYGDGGVAAKEFTDDDVAFQ